MELAGRTALLTGATGGLGQGDRRGAGRARRDARCSAPASARRSRRWPRSCPASGHRVAPRRPRRAGRRRAARRRGGRGRRPRRQRRPARRRPARRTSAPSEVERALRVNLEAPMLMARRSTRRWSSAAPATWSSSPRSPARRPAPAPRSTTRPSSACAASPSACAPTSAPQGVGVSLVSPGFIRDAGMFADAGAKPPPGIGHRHARAGRRGGRQGDRARQGRGRRRARCSSAALAHFALASPGIAVARPERRGRPEGGRGGRRGPPDGQALDATAAQDGAS